MATFESSLKPRIIYVFAIADESHKDYLKIGETTLEEDDGNQLPAPNSEKLNSAARARIDQYTKTAAIQYQLLYTELTLFIKGGVARSFNDKQVHKVLERSGIDKLEYKGAAEWYRCDLETAKKAIAAVKEGRESLDKNEITTGQTPIILRPEQAEAVERTKKRFRRGNQMLWNAKPRFGKTICGLWLAKDLEMTRTIIITHRPVVDAQWFEDFGKIFYDRKDYHYGSKDKGESFESLEKLASKGHKYVYFASMQDMRGSKEVGGKFDKNNEIFSTTWDFLIVDEAHEGTKTELGQAVIAQLRGENTKMISLSGTPFNLLDDFDDEEVYTWDYIMEQKAKIDWEISHLGDANPYADLPSINIFTYELGTLMSEFSDEEKAFNFYEFFRTREDESFIYDQYIDRFLNLLCEDSEDSLYPFSNDRFRKIFRHTLWILPGVKAARALSIKLRNHPIFGDFEIVNVAGNGDDDEERKDALELVNRAIGPDSDESFTITLSCGRLTTGVSVKPWTGVFMMAGAYSTSASTYMQTIFRVQTPYTHKGRMKTECYAFDFAPDRTLRVLAEAAKVSAKAGKQTEEDRKILGDFLNFCPIVAIKGGKMKPFNVNTMLGQLKRAQIEKVVQCGFEDGALYNDELLKLTEVELKDFSELKATIGKTKAMPRPGDIDINRQGLTNEQYEEKEKLGNKSKNERTPEEQKRFEELKALGNQRREAISILRGISIRMPLMLYGAEIKDEDKELSIDNFTNLVDDQSWEEFMPRGITKDVFNRFKRYYDKDVFREAGKRIREMARMADKFTIEERISRISAIFSTFRNPDKETVLTPWRVVNMHLGDCLGGYCFMNETYSQSLDIPRYILQDGVTQKVFTPNSIIMEINSKSGLYPLYAAYNIYRTRVEAARKKYGEVSHGFAMQLWDLTLEQNILVVCMTPMARSITRRTLAGFRDTTVRAEYYPNLIENITQNPECVVNMLRNGKQFWKINESKDMKIDAIIGNPPYQKMDGGAGASAVPVYNKFVTISKSLSSHYISLIMPARWYSGGRGLDEFRQNMIDDKRMVVLHDFVNAQFIFSNVEIKGGICYFLWDSKWNKECNISTHITNEEVIKSKRYLNNNNDTIFIRDPRILTIKNLVTSYREKYKEKTFDTIVSAMKPYGLRGDFFKNPRRYNLPPISKEPIVDGIVIVGLGENMKRTKRYVPKDYPLPSVTGIETYKIFIPRNWGTGKLQDTTFKTYLAQPYEICTETFVQVFPFNSIEERDNCNKYIQTKFFRIMVSTIKQDQGAGKDVYSFVPLQDFTENSDINWTKTVTEIDQQLYSKYGLSKDDIKFIEKEIKPME